MKICIPVNSNNGLDSEVCEHFGSAPCFLIVDSDTLAIDSINNNNSHHAHGMCQPLALISGKNIQAIVVGGIGAGALNKLQASGMDVFKAQHRTVRETVAAYKAGSLSPVNPHSACSGHSHNGPPTCS